MTGALVIAIAGTASGAARSSEPPHSWAAASEVTKSETLRPCTARAGLRFYSRRYNEWRGKMGAGVPKGREAGDAACPRYLANLMRSKARAARVAYERWHFYHYRWDHWLPAKWFRIARCETGVNWRHSNSSYEGAFGFAKQSWDSFKYRADPKAGPYPQDAWQATPRQQYEVALAIYRVFGFSGWGCRGA